MIKKIFNGLGVILLLVLVIALFMGYQMLGVLNGYAAKRACTCHYAGGKSLEEIKERELAFSPINLAEIQVDETQKSLTANTYGLHDRRAMYKPGQGCVLINGIDKYEFEYSIDKSSLKVFDFEHKSDIEGYDQQKISQALKYAFTDSYHTDAILVVHHDSIILEKYAPETTKETPLLGWSMTKSIMNALAGIMVKNNKLDLQDDHLFDAWKNDDRAKITLNHLLQMTSGLEWEEEYSKISDATKMLYLVDDIVSHTTSVNLAHDPGTHWYYSSGTSNIIAGLIRDRLGDREAYIHFPYDSLFLRMGMSSAFIETDESGNFIGSSYGYATARDWAKFGRLYLEDGIWNGDRILPSGWVDYSLSKAKNDICWYGAQFWLNHDQCNYKNLPADLFVCNGFEGQRLMMFPTQELIILRLGSNDAFNEEKFAISILDALEKNIPSE